MDDNFFRSVEKHPTITPGEYKGLQSAYYLEIIFENGKRSPKIEMHCGVRGINCETDVRVTEDGWVEII